MQRTQPGTPIRWRCSICGDDGTISNWEESPFDLRRQRLVLTGTLHEISIPNEVAATLRDLQLLDTDCERTVFAIGAHNNNAPSPKAHRCDSGGATARSRDLTTQLVVIAMMPIIQRLSTVRPTSFGDEMAAVGD